jgi:hypothetical protein
MSRIVVVVLIYHRHKPIDLIEHIEWNKIGRVYESLIENEQVSQQRLKAKLTLSVVFC